MELNAITREYAQLLWEEAKDEKEDKCYVIYNVPHCNPELDFVDVNFLVRYYPALGSRKEHVNLRLVLKSMNIETYEDPYTYMYRFKSTNIKFCHNLTSVEELEKEIQLYHKTIHNFKFSKLTGEFFDPTDKKIMRKMRLQELKDEVFLKTTEPDVCCVCLENTQSKTKCGHSLCFHCYEKLEKMTCPCCRGKIKCHDGSDNEDED